MNTRKGLSMLIAAVMLLDLLVACAAAPETSTSSGSSDAQPSEAPVVTTRTLTLSKIDGTVDVQANGGDSAPATRGLKLNKGDLIQTGSNSKAIITQEDGTQTV